MSVTNGDTFSLLGGEKSRKTKIDLGCGIEKAFDVISKFKSHRVQPPHMMAKATSKAHRLSEV